ncbi:MAG: hypothetical protein RLZZ461_2047 [Planctomycetota bacterium]|jgi:hypothetical protein
MRLIIAAIVGTVVVFVWGGLAWMALGIWDDSVENLRPADAVMAAISENVTEPGVYVFPPEPEVEDPDDDAAMTVATEEWMTRMSEGPTGVLLVHPKGIKGSMEGMFATGIALEFAGSLLLAILLSTAARAGCGFGGRLAIGIAIIGFAAISGVIVPANFMHHPAGWTRAMAGDLAIGWGLAVVVMSMIIKKPRTSRHA